jgi:predicted PolB exonuclease-like 3'-5' exonuclease
VIKYLVADVESFRNDVPWDPPDGDPNAFAPLPCHGIAAIGGLVIEISDGKNETGRNRCSFLGTFGEIGDKSTEYSRIEAFIKYYRNARPIVFATFNGRRFDIPVLWMRAMHFGLPIPEFFHKDFSYRYAIERSFDIYDVMGNFGSANIGTVDQFCGVIGLPGKMDVDGSKVHALFEAGEYRKIHSYVQCDVIEEALILLRCLHVRGELSAVVVNNLIHSVKNAALGKNDEMVTRLVNHIDFPRLEVPYNILNAPKPQQQEPQPPQKTPDPTCSEFHEAIEPSDTEGMDDNDDQNTGGLTREESDDGIPF